MNLIATDIIVRKYKGKTTLWLSQRLVMQECGISDEYNRRIRNFFKSSIHNNYRRGAFLPDTGRSWRWGRKNNTFYYDFDRIPDRLPTRYRSKLGTKQTLIEAWEALNAKNHDDKMALIKADIQSRVEALIDNADLAYYLYQNPIGGFTQQQAREMASGRAWCRYINRQLRDDNFKSLGITQKNQFYQLCTELIAPQELEGFKVTNADYLRQKVAQFPQGEDIDRQRQFFISGSYGNNNAQIVGLYPIINEDTGEVHQFDVHQAIMYNLYMNPGQPSKEYLRGLFLKYAEDIQDFELVPVSYRSFCHHLSRFDRRMLMAKERHGTDWYKKHALTYVPSQKLRYAHSLFAGDGSGTIQYKYYRGGKVKEMKLYTILITDIATRYITGFAVSREGFSEETPDMVQQAVKMAVTNAGEQTMFEFVSDNHGAFTADRSKKFLNRVFNKVRTIQPKNSQANPAETQFRLFKRSLKDIYNFVSTSWQAGLEGQNNPDYNDINALPNYADACIQLSQLIKRWNETPLQDGISPKERFEKNKHPDIEQMDPRNLRWLFAKHTERELNGSRGFVKVERSHGYADREVFLFEIPQFETAGAEALAKATGYTYGAKVKVVWDEDYADLYTLEGVYIMTCPRTSLSSQSEAEMTDENRRALGHHLNRKKDQLAAVSAWEQAAFDALNTLENGEGAIDTPVFRPSSITNDDLPYTQAMSFGGNKETYNKSRIENEVQSKKEKTKDRVDRDFNADAWSDLNN